MKSVATRSVTCNDPKSRFIRWFQRYAVSCREAMPILPEISIIAVSHGPRKKVPKRMADTVTIHLKVSHLCLKKPQLLKRE